jgi:hypothetical protein
LRQENKEVDGFELEREEERKRQSDLVEDSERELYDLDGKPEFHRDEAKTSSVAAAMQTILAREHIVINNLDLDKRELRALEALKTAVDGRDQSINGFVFAEDRRALLEQALAVLQPDLVNLERAGGLSFETLVKDVGELRGKLDSLEDAQEEIEPHKVAAAKGEAGDTDDDDDDDESNDDDDDKSLTGPERKISKPSSSLAGPERKPEPKPASALTGPEHKAEAKPASSLGDAKEITEAARKPWWKRLTGG